MAELNETVQEFDIYKNKQDDKKELEIKKELKINPKQKMLRVKSIKAISSSDVSHPRITNRIKSR